MNPEEGYMRKALAIARLGQGKVEPNPMVGAVVVSGGNVIGTGYHMKFGGPHAEVNALASAGDRARGATIYVTLEPCDKYGKTPPCTHALGAAGISRVVAASRDPLQPSSEETLKKLGIKAEYGLLEREALQLNAPYFKLISTGLPYVTAKWAMTLDGRVSIPQARERWVSNEQSRSHVQRVRGVMDVIILGIGTVLADDPELTCRIASPRKPARVILDSKARIPLDATLVRTIDIAELVIATTPQAPKKKLSALEKAGCRIMITEPKGARVDLAQVLEKLGAERTTNVLVEGGPTVFAAAFKQGLVDKVMVYVSSKIVGDGSSRAAIEQSTSLPSPLHLQGVTYQSFGDDVMIMGVVPDRFRDLRPRKPAASKQQ